MDELNQAIEAAKVLGASQVVPDFYKDGFQPAVKVMGRNLELVAKAVSVALAPVQGLVWTYGRIKDYLSETVTANLADKLPEDIIPPSPVIAGPVILNISFAAEEPHLREMYAKLLSRAMHKPDKEKAHPSFVQIIQQLSPAEAKIIEHFGKTKRAGEIIFLETCTDDPIAYFEADSTLCKQWHRFCNETIPGSGDLADAYYYNLIRLGLLVERLESTVESDDITVTFRGHFTKLKNKRKISLMLTDYGDLFLDVCVR